MKQVFIAINRWERVHIKRQYRRTGGYFLCKFILLLPLILLHYLIGGCSWIYNAIVRGRIKRTNNTDIVFSNIVAGFAGLAFPDEKTEALAKRRADICAGCPFAVKSGIYSAVVDNRTTQIQGMKCDKCGCNLSAKVRSVQDYCPIGKW